MGVPTILLLPSTTAVAPWTVAPDRLMSSMHPLGVHGRNPEESNPCERRPALAVVRLEGGITKILMMRKGRENSQQAKCLGMITKGSLLTPRTNYWCPLSV